MRKMRDHISFASVGSKTNNILDFRFLGRFATEIVDSLWAVLNVIALTNLTRW